MQALHNYGAEHVPHTLGFPIGYPYSTALAAYDEPTIAIRQFSSGRSHILGLSDSGRIWSWYATNKPALHVKFLNVDITEASAGESSPANKPLYGRIKQVVAGWSCSSAYIYGTGIVVWNPVHRATSDHDEMDTMLILENVEVPKTAYQRVKGASRETDEDKALGEEVGAVLNYIILENYVVFVTDIGKVFCGKFGEKNHVEEVLELRALRNENGTPLDVQGSFRRFAIFKNSEVITTNQDYLDVCWNERDNNREQEGIDGLQKIPALQQNDVISVAFGDYHFLALHSTGKITSYGTELQACGALGLGGDGDPEGRTRGIRYTGFSHDGKLLSHAYTHGRQVWFEPEKKKWITFMTSGGKDPDEAKERMRMFVTDANVQGEVSEWFEQEGRDWDKDPELEDADEDGLGSYFALSISAAGWHSGAVVLVNQKLAHRVREKCIVKDPDAPGEFTFPSRSVSQFQRQDLPVRSAGSAIYRKTADSHAASSSQQGNGPDSWGSWLANMGRAFLGLQLAEEQQNDQQESTSRHDPLSSFLDPVSHGASPGKGYKYTWAENSFPRLKLSDGTEMPGRVGFDEWRFGRPEWQLDVEV